MKSSVRILAIALALAFLLLARSAFQDTSSASADAIKLKDGEASFADLHDGTMEAEYLGFNMDDEEHEDAKFSYVYFYIMSEDLGTQMTATVMASGTEIDDTGVAMDQSTSPNAEVITLEGGNMVAATFGATSTVVVDIDNAYCSTLTNIATTTATAARTGSRLGEVTTPSYTYTVPGGWALAPDAVDGAGTAADCSGITASFGGGDANRGTTGVSTTSAETREMLAGVERDKVLELERLWALSQNQAYYTYDGDDYSDVHPTLRYTHGELGTDVGGDLRPLSSVKATLVPSPAPETATVDHLTFITNDDGNQFQAFALQNVAAADALRVELTYDVQDVYAADEDESMDHDGYSSGFGRAYVSSGSDSGMWVTITEVADETDNVAGDDSATSNLFQGMVKIVNDTDLEGDDVIYAQDGDTLTLQVFDENGKRSSDVLASATAIIDNAAPTISDLSPADESVIKDDTLQISFNVNDEGSGLDFRAVDEKAVVLRVEAQVIQDDKMGTVCDLTMNADDIDNAGGNASRVGVLISPSGDDAEFSARCGNVIDPDLGPDAPGGNGNTHGNRFNLIITSQDLAGNIAKHTTQLTIDTEAPTVMGNPKAGQAWNEDDNKASGSANSILVQFNESLDVDTVAASDFTVAGYTIDSVEVVGTNEDGGEKNRNEYVVLTLTEDLAKNARPSVAVSGVTDVAGNAIEAVTRTSENKIAAAITVVPFWALIAEDGEQAISFTSDEALRSMGGDYKTEASVNGNRTGLAIKVADDTMGGNATFKQSTFDESRAYGVMLRAVDVNGNKTDVGAVSVSDEDVKLSADQAAGATSDAATFNVKLKNWPPADSNLNGSFAGEVKAYVGEHHGRVFDQHADPDWVERQRLIWRLTPVLDQATLNVDRKGRARSPSSTSYVTRRPGNPGRHVNESR